MTLDFTFLPFSVTSCGGIMNQRTNTIRHPSNGQSRYQNNQRCVWLIKADGYDRIEFKQNQMDLEPSQCKCIGQSSIF